MSVEKLSFVEWTTSPSSSVRFVMPPTPRASSSNEAALLLKLEQLTGGVDPEKSDETWVESLVVTAPEPLQLDDPDDDLKRELAFYNQALSAVRVAQERLDRLGIPHVRPDDYFAEMVKTDKHMSKVKMRMLREQTDIAAAEERRKQSANKKFGKQVQHEVLQARQQEKRRNMVEVKELRKKRKGAGDDGFDGGTGGICGDGCSRAASA